MEAFFLENNFATKGLNVNLYLLAFRPLDI